ncbi:MAG: hypothetical protein GYA61_04625 [Spirochaetales bacterium]|jgi:hypothetical protein|nr:hypothetical protein [Exilispira sp.]NMC67496.1 hypothetical protein [Spirochaetales bacterium]
MIIWKETIEQIIENKTISKNKLKIVPKLRTCSDWYSVKPLGIINYSSPLMKWDGYLVEFSNQLFYVEKTTYENISKDLKWKIKDNITVEE